MTRLSDLYGMQVKAYNGKATTWNDLFGVEMEIENLTDMPEIAGWVVKNDGSLRNGYEYITARPIGGDELRQAIDRFYSAKFKYTNGPRTSTHIHVNATDMTVDNLRTMILIMYTIEDALFTAIGETRKWAGYAMPLREMETSRLRAILSSNDPQVLNRNISTKRNQDRYYGFNIAVQRHGTVEFRYFPGGPSKEELSSWLDLVCAVKKAALSLPVESLAGYANDGTELVHFLRRILPPYWFQRLTALTTTEDLLANFAEVAALCFGDESPTRRELIVFGSNSLRKYINKTLFRGGGRDYIEGIITSLPVMTLGDWSYHMMRAWEQEAGSTDKPVRKMLDEQYADLQAQRLPRGFAGRDVQPLRVAEWDIPTAPPEYADTDAANVEAAIIQARRTIEARRQELEANRRDAPPRFVAPGAENRRTGRAAQQNAWEAAVTAADVFAEDVVYPNPFDVRRHR